MYIEEGKYKFILLIEKNVERNFVPQVKKCLPIFYFIITKPEHITPFIGNCILCLYFSYVMKCCIFELVVLTICDFCFE